MDETGLSIVHKPGRVVAELGRRNVWAVTSAEKGKTHTINIMSGFRKCGLYPLNCGEINDRVLAPSIASRKNDSHSNTPAEATGWDEDLFEKRYKRGTTSMMRRTCPG